MQIPDSMIALMRKSGQAASEARGRPAWRALGMQLAEAQALADNPASEDAARRAYLYALAVQGGRILAEMERLLGKPKTLEETSDAAIG